MCPDRLVLERLSDIELGSLRKGYTVDIKKSCIVIFCCKPIIATDSLLASRESVYASLQFQVKTPSDKIASMLKFISVNVSVVTL
jgi:hypothetical protein